MADNVQSPYRKGETFKQFIKRTGGAGMFTCWICKEYLHVEAQALVNHITISHLKWDQNIINQERQSRFEALRREAKVT